MSDLFEPIAVVGISGRFPGARDVREYWRNLAAGRESVTALTDDELLAAGAPREDIADPAYVRMAGLVPGVDSFDAGFFDMTPREADVCDPQLRLFLEVTHEAVEDAGYSLDRLGRDVAVYGACGPSRYGDMHVMTNPELASASDILGLSTLNNIDFLSTLVSYKLDLRGPSMAVLTACSSSLAAVHLACRSLQLGDCDTALAGASYVAMPYGVGYRWGPGDVRSPDGHCRPFDATASGTVFTGGAGAVLLKRHRDAVADGDHVWAVVHGIGSNNDGSDKVSFSAPSVGGVTDAIVDAMAMSGFGAGDIDCIEMHATGTPLGDPIEMTAQAEAYRRLADGSPVTGPIPVGSVKSNVGHTATAAGLAGLLKLLLALENERIPPSINVASTNPRLDIESTPFVVNDTLRPWRRDAARPRRAGLTSLGMGGTNLHLVLEEGPTPVPTPHLGRPRVVVWSGRDDAAADANRAALAEHFAEAGDDTFADATATLQRGRTAHPVRGAAVCTSAEEAARALAGQAAVSKGRAGADPPEVVFTFPGQAAQHPRMGAGAYGRQRVFTETVDVCLDAFARQDLDLYPLWLAEAPGDHLYETVNAQPLLFAVEYALARQWVEWGVRPTALLGHSVGEMVAATLAGVLDLDDALRLVVLRGRAMQRRPRGAMVVAATDPARLPAVLPDGSGVAVAAVNAADQTVLSGSAEDVQDAVDALTAAGVPTRQLRTSHAFHGPAMRPAVDELLAGFDGVPLQPPRVPVYSAATGKRLTDEEACDPGFWARQLAEPVLYADAVTAATEGNALTEDADSRVLLEVGPGRTLTGLAQRHPAVEAGRWRALASLPRADGQGEGDERTLLGTLAELWLTGCRVEWSSVYRDEAPQQVSLPGYRFQRQRHWVGPVTGPATAPPEAAVEDAPSGATAAPAEDTAAPAADEGAGPFTVPSWVEAPLPVPGGGAVPPSDVLALVPADAAASLPYVNALQQAGHRVVRVRPGDEPTERAGEYVVRPDHLGEDLEQVLGRLAAAPTMLVHAWGVGAPPGTGDELDRTFFALLDLVKTAARRPVESRLPSLYVLTSGAVDVSGGEAVVPARAALVAAARTFGMESPGTVCRVVDDGAVCAEDQLVAELASGASDPLVALRGTRRWVPVQRPWTVVPGREQAVRRGGVYVLTGGLGGLGIAVAKGLAATGRRPRLALLARSARERSDDLAEIESMGADVRVVTCDVADRAQLGAALDDVEDAFGPVNGVLHLAGVAGGGMLQLRGRADAERVLRPKVEGTVALADALADRPPVDFVVCFSSRAAVSGMVGGGDYAAANAFQDAFAAGRPGWLSIDWPAWTTVGMASGGVLDELTAAVHAALAPGGNGVARPSSGTHSDTVLSAATDWVLDEHRVGDAAVLPGTGVVDLVLRTYLDEVPGATAPVTLRDLTFLRPLVGEAPRLTRVSLEPAGEGSWQVEVLSRPDADAEAAWEVHATCMLTSGGAPAPRVDVDELAAGLPEVPAPGARPAPGSGMTFGPRWRCVDRLWETDTVMVAELALPAAFVTEDSGHAAHPALLDIGTGLLRRRAPSELLVPFLYREMTWYAPIPHRVHCRISQHEGTGLSADVELVADDGTVVTEVKGFRLRSPRSDDFAGERSGGGRAVEPASGLRPDEGVRLLLQLLEASTPAQVAVAPHQHGHPVQPPAPAPAAAPVPQEPAGGAGDGSVQDRLAALWRQVLGRSGVEPGDDFFELGGDSLMGVALVGRIRDAFAVELSIGSLFESPTLAELAAVVEQASPTSTQGGNSA